jgi:hypothetical protein
MSTKCRLNVDKITKLDMLGYVGTLLSDVYVYRESYNVNVKIFGVEFDR